MTAPLVPILRRVMEAEGPISIARYMDIALAHPNHGYYRNRDPFGAGGDFITAPEVSQMFGELLGLWCAMVWDRMERPPAVNLVEVGPGRGTLARDALRAIRVSPDFFGAVSLHLVETSPALRERQRTALADCGRPVSWHDDLSTLPDGPLLLLANEFVDALPIHQFVRQADGWHERRVTWDADQDGFAFVVESEVSERAAALLPDALYAFAETGALAECRPAADRWAADLAGRLNRFGGAALVIDYGHARGAPGDTLQAVRHHAYHPVLEDPGEADLTAHVDFQALARAAKAAGASAQGPLEQGAMLAALGIGQRAEQLMAGATREQRQAIVAGLRRLTAPDQMGTLFKVLCLCPPGLAPLPPFEEVS